MIIYKCDRCGFETQDEKEITNINFNSLHGTVQINSHLCIKCWKKLIDQISEFIKSTDKVMN